MRHLGSTVALFAVLMTATLPLSVDSSANAFPQQVHVIPPVKKILKVDDYTRWRSITEPTISDDGAWTAYGFSKLNAFDPEVTLHVKSLRNDTAFEFLNASGPRFSDDSRWIAYFVDPPYEEAQKLERQEAPRPRTTRLLNLATGERFSWDNAAAFQFSAGSGFLAVKKARLDPSAKHDGSDLILRDLRLGTEQLIGSVNEFSFDQQLIAELKHQPDRNAHRLAYTVDATDQTGNGLYLIELDNRTLWPLDNDARTYSRLTWSSDGRGLAVLKGNNPVGQAERLNILLTFRSLDTLTGTTDVPITTQLDPRFEDTFPDGMVISERSRISWSKDLGHVFFGLDEQQAIVEEPENPDRVANVDIWHVQDERIQSVQMAEANQDRNFTYQAALVLDSEHFVRLTDETMHRITLSQDGRWGIGIDDKPYISDWREAQADYYRVNIITGERTPIIQGQQLTLGLSPDGQHFLYWRSEHLWLYELESGDTRNLTANAPVSFVNKEYDYPGTAPPYGVAGWTTDGTALLLNHRYDLWLQPLDGSPATNFTSGQGDSREIRFRHVQTDAGEHTIDLSGPILLSAYGQWTKQAGYFHLTDGELEELVLTDHRFGLPLKAQGAQVYLTTRETFEEFPDLYVSDDNFANLQRITDANPWQAEYRWGRRILFDYSNDDGVRLQGTLAVPDNYAPGDRRPMLVNFYEKNSQDLHRHIAPRYASGFGSPLIEAVSKGYLVMQADIHFRTGNTHADMLECVEAATRKVIALGYANPQRIGLHGHSFSGQGSAYIAGNSKMFAAVAAGAAATDLLNDFNHMWGWTPTNMHGTGANAHRYDYYGQGRLGTNPYDDRELYLRESPTTHVRNLDSPLLLMHGTADGVVAVMESVQLYNGLRFNDKNVILLAYPGEGHGLRNLANRRDLTIRMQDFFDHHLLDSPPADWIIKGIPFLDKHHGAWERGSS